VVHIVGALGLHIFVRFMIDKAVCTIFIVAFAAYVFIGSASLAFTFALWAKVWTILVLMTLKPRMSWFKIGVQRTFLIVLHSTLLSIVIIPMIVVFPTATMAIVVATMFLIVIVAIVGASSIIMAIAGVVASSTAIMLAFASTAAIV
jgi:hypothetical protein